MNNEKIGNFIKQNRKAKNLTQKELADKLHITDRAISKWERGLNCPDISLLEQLAQILEVSILEILKGEKLTTNQIQTKDIIDSMHLSQKLTIDKIQKISNLFTITSVIIFITFILVTNLKSIQLLTQNYDMITNNASSASAQTNYQNYQHQITLIENNQGQFTLEDYSTIKNYLKIMSTRLQEQNNDQYLTKQTLTFKELLQFYIDHNNLYTLEINNLDLYKLLLKYDTTIIDNLINYTKTQDLITKELSYEHFFLQEPYNTIKINQKYPEYLPNTYYMINLIYKNEVTLLNDIIKVGNIHETN